MDRTLPTAGGVSGGHVRTYDVEGRLQTKQYADASTVTDAYETTTSRLKSVTDALSQVKSYNYTADNRLGGIMYSAVVNPTPNVTYSYDPYYPRLTSMTDGSGTTAYSYVPIGMLGALEVQQAIGPLTNGSVTYTYDALGRVASRTVSGSGAETYQYDAIGRLTADTNDLGAFSLSYLGQTAQITGRQLMTGGSSLSTAWSYLNNMGDRRLAEINNTGLTSGQFTNFQFNTTPEDQIAGITQTSDTTISEPGAGSQSTSYNALNQLTNLSGQARSYDADGNLVSDGMRSYSWDAENRLVQITYPGQTGKQTAFSYDGLGRRTAITSTPVSGGSVTTSYIWCGGTPCQARNSSDVPIRSYYSEGEFVPGGTGQSFYYAVDQLGSVRRVFGSTTNAPAYDYSPFGQPLNSTAAVTDRGFAGLMQNLDSGLDLATFRPYDPVTAQWLTRDPLGERVFPFTPLYQYAQNSPLVYIDPLGLACQVFVNAGLTGIVPGFGASVSITGGLNFSGGGVQPYFAMQAAAGPGQGEFFGGGFGPGGGVGASPSSGTAAYSETDVGGEAGSVQATSSVDSSGNVNVGGSAASAKAGFGEGAGQFVGQSATIVIK